MKIRFACPSCGFSGFLDAASAGKTVRCKHCGGRSTVPVAGEPEASVYTLEEPSAEPAREIGRAGEGESVFVASGGDGTLTDPLPSRKVRRAPRAVARNRGANLAWLYWLIGLGAATTLGLLAVSLLVPSGTLIAACVAILIGSAMLLTGYFAGAYGAFHEDFVYGVLYLLIPLYTAYYLVTRWDDLWIWCTCSTAGVGLILLGTQVARWSGVGVSP
jgi:hypothetical protein